jgi:XTP/dITP diphosphohydrolase
MIVIYSATSNPGKLREFQRAAHDFSNSGTAFEVRPMPVNIAPPEETCDTFEANAIEKALSYNKHVSGYLFADDSGLEVDSLGGAPGVHSARFAGEHATDAENNALLLERLRGVANRAARFVCVIALMRDGRLIQTFRGAVEGKIIDQARGATGFGYDPLFYHPPFGCTFGEASLEQKMRVSHRGQALEQMFTFLRNTSAT